MTTIKDPYPESVFDFGLWLKAHPWIVRVRLDVETFERYVLQLESNSRPLPESGAWPVEFFTWRYRVAVILDRAWSHRRILWPERCYRRRTVCDAYEATLTVHPPVVSVVRATLADVQIPEGY